MLRGATQHLRRALGAEGRARCPSQRNTSPSSRMWCAQGGASSFPEVKPGTSANKRGMSKTGHQTHAVQHMSV
eukprot:6423007-Pyramimonas_sp.AAC.1